MGGRGNWAEIEKRMERVVSLLEIEKGKVVPSWLLVPVPLCVQSQTPVSTYHVLCQCLFHLEPHTHYLLGAVPSMLGG